MKTFLTVLILTAFAQGTGLASERTELWTTAVEGHARTMFEGFRGLEFGLGAVDRDDWIHQRIQVKGTLHQGDSLTLVSELTWGRMWGKESALAPPDQDSPDFLQLYAQARLPWSDDSLEIRAGRQTLYYGSGRLLASREGLNQRLAHDALLLSWQEKDGLRVDAFVASPAQVKPDAFDNISDPAGLLLWSLYSVIPLTGNHFADLFYIGLQDEDSSLSADGSRETRHTLGLRNWNRGEDFSYNSEVIVQFGSVQGRDISAGAASLGISQAFSSLPGKPVLELRADAISGGQDSGAVHTFNPLFQSNNYFNEGGFLAPSNLYNLNPILTFHPSRHFKASLGVNFQWLFSTRDAIYGPPLQPLGQPLQGSDRYLGTALNASVEWEPMPRTTLFLGATHHRAGPALTAIDGQDANYFQASVRFEF